MHSTGYNYPSPCSALELNAPHADVFLFLLAQPTPSRCRVSHEGWHWTPALVNPVVQALWRTLRRPNTSLARVTTFSSRSKAVVDLLQQLERWQGSSKPPAKARAVRPLTSALQYKLQPKQQPRRGSLQPTGSAGLYQYQEQRGSSGASRSSLVVLLHCVRSGSTKSPQSCCCSRAPSSAWCGRLCRASTLTSTCSPRTPCWPCRRHARHTWWALWRTVTCVPSTPRG